MSNYTPDTEDIINRRVHKITLQFHNAIDDNVIVDASFDHELTGTSTTSYPLETEKKIIKLTAKDSNGYLFNDWTKLVEQTSSNKLYDIRMKNEVGSLISTQDMSYNFIDNNSSQYDSTNDNVSVEFAMNLSKKLRVQIRNYSNAIQYKPNKYLKTIPNYNSYVSYQHNQNTDLLNSGVAKELLTKPTIAAAKFYFEDTVGEYTVEPSFNVVVNNNTVFVYADQGINIISQGGDWKTLFTLGTSNTLIAVDNITEIQNVWETWNPWLRVFPLNNSVIHIYNKPIYLDIAQTSTKIQWRSYDQGTGTSKNITSMKLQFYTPPINYTVNGNWSYLDGSDNEILLYRSIADASYAETYTDLITISNNILVNVSIHRIQRIMQYTHYILQI